VIFYHGTELASAQSLHHDLLLDAAIAADLHIDGADGFYMATRFEDAEFFAARRAIVGEPAVVRLESSSAAYGELVAAGAKTQPIPGGRPPYFKGEELFVPAALFEHFNQLVRRGEIVVVKHPAD